MYYLFIKHYCGVKVKLNIWFLNFGYSLEYISKSEYAYVNF